MVRKFLDGRFENTAFCILAPDGETQLSGTGRGPEQALRRGRGRLDDENVVTRARNLRLGVQDKRKT